MASVSNIRTRFRPKVPARSAVDKAATISDVRRTVLAVVLVAVAGVAGALAYRRPGQRAGIRPPDCRGRRAVAGERPFQAIEAYSGAIALKPDSMLAYLKRGAVYQAQNELEAALRDFRSAAELDPELAARARIARRRQRRARPARARHRALRGLYHASTIATPASSTSWGCARYRAGRDCCRDGQRLQQALAIDPAMGEAHYLLGLVQRDLGQAAGRSQVARRGGTALPGQPDGRARSAGRCLSAGRRSRQGDQSARGAGGPRARARRRLVAVGLAQARAGRDDAAVITLGRAVERFPDAPQATPRSATCG